MFKFKVVLLKKNVVDFENEFLLLNFLFTYILYMI